MTDRDALREALTDMTAAYHQERAHDGRWDACQHPRCQNARLAMEGRGPFAIARASPLPLDVERRTIDNCIAIVQQSLDTVRAEDDGESRSIKASIAAREHVITMLNGYRTRAYAAEETP